MNASILKLDLLFQLGRKDEAWHELDALAKSFNAEEVSVSKAAVLVAWVRDALDLRSLNQVEAKLLSALDFCRHKGYKIHEPELYSLYARYLHLSGDLEVPLDRVPDRTLGEKSKTSEAGPQDPTKGIADEDKSTPETPSSKAVSGIILQSARIQTTPLAGLEARAFFSLQNAESRSRKGALRIRGPAASCKMDGGELQCSFEPGKPVREIDHAVTLDANQSLAITVRTTEAPGTGNGTVELAYHEAAAEGPRSVWYFNAAGDGRTSAIVDAHFIENNPFYLFPVTHSVQVGGSGERVVNLRCKASVPTRIEAYLSTGEPLFIDATGNGSLRDQGDVLFRDADRDGFSDLILEDRANHSSVTFYYQPLEQSKAMTVDIETNSDREWQFDSQDTIHSE
jgi:hypothetical protein